VTAKPTLSTVAQEAGGSIPTASQVLRGTGRISDQTRDKVLQAAAWRRDVPDLARAGHAVRREP